MQRFQHWRSRRSAILWLLFATAAAWLYSQSSEYAPGHGGPEDRFMRFLLGVITFGLTPVIAAWKWHAISVAPSAIRAWLAGLWRFTTGATPRRLMRWWLTFVASAMALVAIVLPYGSARGDILEIIVTFVLGFLLLGAFPIVIVWLSLKIAHVIPPHARRASIAMVSVAVIAGVLFVVVDPLRHDELAFSEAPTCEKSGPGALRSGSPVTEWIGNDLRVRYQVCANCFHRIQDVSARVFAGRIHISTKYGGKGYAMCDCARTVVLDLKGLPRREYAILGIKSFRNCM